MKLITDEIIEDLTPEGLCEESSFIEIAIGLSDLTIDPYGCVEGFV